MRIECTAISPQYICSFAWKQPPARPAIFQRAQKLLNRSGEGNGSGDTDVAHTAISWKAYLAAREVQHLASDMVEGFFSALRGPKPVTPVRPAILKTSPCAVPGGPEPRRRSLLAPVLPETIAAMQETAPAGTTAALAIAA